MRKRILIVDTNEDYIRVLRYRLDQVADFEIEVVSDGAQALNVIPEGRFDLIFLNLRLPVLDGWSVLQELQKAEATRSIPIIALTRNSMAGDEAKALEMGCRDHLAKPVVDSSLVRQKIERLIDI